MNIDTVINLQALVIAQQFPPHVLCLVQDPGPTLHSVVMSSGFPKPLTIHLCCRSWLTLLGVQVTYFVDTILPWVYQMFFLFKEFIYLFWDSGEGREKERERNISVWLPLVHPLLGTWPTTQVCTLTGNWTGDPLVRRPVLNPLSHTSQGWCFFMISLRLCIFGKKFFFIFYFEYFRFTTEFQK